MSKGEPEREFGTPIFDHHSLTPLYSIPCSVNFCDLTECNVKSEMKPMNVISELCHVCQSSTDNDNDFGTSHCEFDYGIMIF